PAEGTTKAASREGIESAVLQHPATPSTDSLSPGQASPNMSRRVFMRNLHLPSSASTGGQAMVRRSKSSGLNLSLTILLRVLAVMASSVLLTAQQSTPSSHPAA